MESGGTVVSATEAGSTVVAAAIAIHTDTARTAVGSATIAVPIASAVAARVAIAATIAVSAAIAIVGVCTPTPAAPRMAPAPTPWTSPPTAEPWASADKEAAGEPVCTVIAIRRAGIRIIRVVAPAADRRATYVNRCRIINHWADADADSNLSMSRRHECNRNYESREQSK
jgi:hypothetical protein